MPKMASGPGPHQLKSTLIQQEPAQEDRAAGAVLVGMLREAER